MTSISTSPAAPVAGTVQASDAEQGPHRSVGVVPLGGCGAAAQGATGSGQQILTLTGLRFDASLGILEHEKSDPQPIQVDAELNLGSQPLAPRDDDILHVLDYRKVRQIIIDECTSEHVNLLESLIGKLAQRLLLLPGVRGVRVKIAKLEIFEDCEVAIRIETGQW